MARETKVDRFGIPTLDSVLSMPLTKHDETDSRFEKILGRKLTPTEKSAADSMASEHASYGSSRVYLKTLLPAAGVNHVATIGEEAAAALIWVDPDSKEPIALAYSSESHNWPSYVCAHPGAATGTGGNQRDNVSKTGTKPEAVYEARRQCHPLFNPHNDPVKQHADETTKGIADYANAVGIPHGDGSIKYHPSYSGNNLVNVMAVSIAPRGNLLRNKVPAADSPEKYVGIYVGKVSDATGIGGTKGASCAIDMSKTYLNEKAVQDPDPHLQEAVLRGIEKVVDLAIKEGWKDKLSIKDMGAAGLLCSTVEQLHSDMGVVINGDLVPQNESRNSLELLEAETQERFFIYAHENYAQIILDIFNKEIGLPHINKGACARIIGRCNNSGRYTFLRNSIIDVDVPAGDLMKGPLSFRTVKEPQTQSQEIPARKFSLADEIEAVLNSINFKSDAYVYEHYDKHVRSTNVVNRGQGCATLRTHPLLKNKAGYSVSFDSNCIYGLLDPKLQAEDSFVRGAYKMAAAGCSVIGVTNNANYGRTAVPEEMWEFVRGQEGVAKACYSWELEPAYLDMIAKDPEIARNLNSDARRNVTVNSGNCSLNKANANTGTAIPPTTILGLVGWTNAPWSYATWDLKPVKSKLFLIGARQAALGGTDYLQSLYGPACLGDRLFDIDYRVCQKEVGAVIEAVRKGCVSAANVVEEGGLCNAISEMMANSEVDVAAFVDLSSKMGDDDLTPAQKLFSESHGLILQINGENEKEFLETIHKKGVEAYLIGDIDNARERSGSLNFILNKAQLVRIDQNETKKRYFSKLENMLNGEQS